MELTALRLGFVALGFSQKYGEDYVQVFASVVRHTNLRIFLAIAAKRQYVVHHFDVKTAFLNGTLEKVYMKQPTRYEAPNEEHKVCLLRQGLYGMNMESGYS